MSKVLYQKYRPTKFSDVIGQDHVKITLKNACAANKVGHAYLLTGKRGTGKTSIARIMARMVNCENAPSIDYVDEDKMVSMINQGKFPDIKELDAATNTSIDDIRKIRMEAYDVPMVGKKRVFIIDEIHCLRDAAASALLKILEEPPPHAIFILCTTDPQRVLPTIHSRCMRFSLKSIRTQEIAKFLGDICNKEGISSYEENAMNLIARSARGSVRDALSMLDSVLSRCGLSVTEKQTSEIVGSIEQESVFNIVKSISIMNSAKSLAYANHMMNLDGKEPEEIFTSLLEFTHDMMVSKQINTHKHLAIEPSILKDWCEIRDNMDTKVLLFWVKKLSSYCNEINNMPRSDLVLNACIVDLVEGTKAILKKS